jgi:hypothetical protein
VAALRARSAPGPACQLGNSLLFHYAARWLLQADVASAVHCDQTLAVNRVALPVSTTRRMATEPDPYQSPCRPRGGQLTQITTFEAAFRPIAICMLLVPRKLVVLGTRVPMP